MLNCCLDLEEIKAQVQQAELGEDQAAISIENARLSLKLAERDYRNTQGLYQDSVATLEQLENAEVQLDNARNQLEAAQKGLAYNKQHVEVANFNLRYSKITAPANGTILRKQAETNELVTPGTPVLIFGSRDKAQVIRVNITDKDIIHIDLGNKASISFDAYPDKSFEGVVKEVASMADPYTNTYEVEIEMLPVSEKLLSGFIGTVEILTDTQLEVFEVPMNALASGDGKKGNVFVVREGRAVKTAVDIVTLMEDQLIVGKGLTDGDEIIMTGIGYLENEQAVEVE